jgi:hypothetical protein
MTSAAHKKTDWTKAQYGHMPARFLTTREDDQLTHADFRVLQIARTFLRKIAEDLWEGWASYARSPRLPRSIARDPRLCEVQGARSRSNVPA